MSDGNTFLYLILRIRNKIIIFLILYKQENLKYFTFNDFDKSILRNFMRLKQNVDIHLKV